MNVDIIAHFVASLSQTCIDFRSYFDFFVPAKRDRETID